MRHRRHPDDEHQVNPVDSAGAASDEEPVREIADLTTDIDNLQKELEELRADAEKSRDQHLRALADFDNFRKRQRDETARQASNARQQLLLKLLPVIDNLERALSSAEQGHSYDALVEGVSLTLRQLQATLAAEGVESIEAVGTQFDPELHEAVMRVDTDEYPENTVIDELERGYKFDGRVLRPSRVRVAAQE